MEITNDYLLKIWGTPPKGYHKHIASIIKNFHKNIETLKANPLNNAESLKLLEKSRKHFMFFEIMYKAKTRFIPNLLSKKADENFQIIRDIKRIYKKEAEKRAISE
jgi:hypothetical protein